MKLPFGKLEVTITKVEENSIQITIHDYHKIDIDKEFVVKQNYSVGDTAFYQIVDIDGVLYQQVA